jgi:hypothetical protein
MVQRLEQVMVPLDMDLPRILHSKQRYMIPIQIQTSGPFSPLQVSLVYTIPLLFSYQTLTSLLQVQISRIMMIPLKTHLSIAWKLSRLIMVMAINLKS